MRTIKFRGKRLDNGEWVVGDLIRHYENQRRFIALDQMAYTYTENGISRLVSERYHEVLPESVGQWTGLVDMDMVEAYEKDVVGVYFRDGEVERAVLIWDANRFKYQLKSSDGSLWGFNDTLRAVS